MTRVMAEGDDALSVASALTGKVGQGPSDAIVSGGNVDRKIFCEIIFFFSSRRRHTRFDCDWSSDVCSSDLTLVASPAAITASSGTSTSTITVTARDQYGNPVRGKTVILSATGTANALVQPRDTTDPNGVATGSLSSTFAEAKVLSATVAGIQITQRDTVTVSPAAATHLAFLVGPSNVAAGAAITPAIQVEVRDQFNNRVTAASPGVSLGFGTNAGGGTLSGGGQQMAANGVATFSAASIDKAGTGHTLGASSAPLTPVTSGLFNVTAAGPTQLALTTPPSSTGRGGAGLAPQAAPAGAAVRSPPAVIVRDASGNPVSGVAVTFAAAAGSGTVTPTTPLTTGTDGIAAATSWTLSTTAGTNTLTATSGTLSGSPVTFTATGTAGAATKLAANSPTRQTAPTGVAVAPPPVEIGKAHD